jgi:hypothetical protein
MKLIKYGTIFTFYRKILSCRCWICSQAWFLATIPSYPVSFERVWGANRPQNQRELFNLRHSSLRVTVERAFGALKNRFRILDNKPFYPYKTQVKLVLACCILHNWILRHGMDEHVPTESSWTPNINDNASQPDHVPDNGTWAQ